MTPLCLVNGQVYTPLEAIRPGTVIVDNDRIAAVGPSEHLVLPGGAEVIDVEGRVVLPGLIDLHFYGCGGVALTGEATIAEDLRAMSRMLPQWGVTAFLISPLAADHQTLLRHLRAIADAIDWLHRVPAGAVPLGIHLEGPYLNPARRGAFRADWLRMPSIEEVETYLDAARGHLRVMTLAPELCHSREVARALHQRGVLPSVGHSDADYETALDALQTDFALVMHVFNGMTGLHHRQPGVVGAVLDSRAATALLISDGIHVHPAAVRLVVRVLGAERLVLVTDAMMATGLGEGEYHFLGQEIHVRGSEARLVDGTLAGSVLTLNRAVANAREFAGLSWGQAARMATLNAARVLGLADQRGALLPGCRADLTVLAEDGHAWLTLVGGKIACASTGARSFSRSVTKKTGRAGGQP
jgi:N-acetylglucosamine-6-phosphate deacetylase